MKNRLILNAGLQPAHPPEENVAAQLRNDMNRLKGEFYDLEKGHVDYFAMRDSDNYRSYAADTALLRDFDPHSLDSREERLAFWINLYNTLVIHGVISLGIRESVKEESRFFSKVAYQIGEQSFSPDDIEHGILRGNHRPPYGFFHPFSSSDARMKLIVKPVDPRIHFTLVCASASCPPINFYSAERIEEQLNVAASGFINGPEVEIDIRDRILRLSPIFKWYRADFDGPKGVINTLIQHLDHGEQRDFLIEQGLAADIEWKAYDWSLNR